MSEPGHWFESQPALVQDGGLLRDPHARVLRRQRRRLRRLPRPAAEARLPAVARDRLHLAAAVLSLAAAGRRLRHRRLLRDQPRLRHRRGLPDVRRRRARAGDPRDRRPRHEPHLGRPPLVPGVPRRPERPQGRLVRLVGHRRAVQRRADHLRRHRDLELDARSGARPVLLAPLLQPPAGPELREPRGAGRDAGGAALLARPRARRLPARRGAVPVRGGGHELREPAADARVPEARAQGGGRELRRTACSSPRRTSGRRTWSSTSEATATSATWPSTSP